MSFISTNVLNDSSHHFRYFQSCHYYFLKDLGLLLFHLLSELHVYLWCWEHRHLLIHLLEHYHLRQLYHHMLFYLHWNLRLIPCYFHSILRMTWRWVVQRKVLVLLFKRKKKWKNNGRMSSLINGTWEKKRRRGRTEKQKRNIHSLLSSCYPFRELKE